MTSPAAVALVSGGLDSCVALAEAVAVHGRRVAVLHATYGQRTATREAAASAAVSDHYGLSTRLQVDLSFLGAMGGSSLTDAGLAIPAAGAGDTTGLSGACEGSVPSTYVPFRNMNLLAAAVAWAEVLGAGQVVCGAHAEGCPYPDTQPAFFTAVDEVIRRGTAAATPIQVHTPLLRLDKAGIVRRGLQLAAPLHLTWSCYQHQDRPCRVCHSCRLRADGFAAVGVADPLLVADGPP